MKARFIILGGLLIVMLIAGYFFWQTKTHETKSPSTTKQTETIKFRPKTESIFNYEPYDKVLGNGTIKAIFYIAVADGVDDLNNTFVYLKPLIDKGVIQISVRNLNSGFITTTIPEENNTSSQLVIGYINCFKTIKPQEYYAYISALESSYVSRSGSGFVNATQVASWLQANLPPNVDNTVMKNCVIKGDYKNEMDKEAVLTSKYVNGTPTIVFPDLNKSSAGRIRSNQEMIERLSPYLDLAKFGFTAPDVNKNIQQILK